MHKTITRDTAVALYRKATQAIKIEAEEYAKGKFFAESVMFISCGLLVQINTHKTGRKEYFTENASDLVDDVIYQNYMDANQAKWLIK